MYASTTLVGYVGGDPTMRYTAEGKPVTSFSVAIGEKWKGQDGQTHEKTIWYRVAAWGKLAETMNQYLKKGTLVLVEGRLQAPKPYQNHNGEWAANLELTANNVRFLSSKKDGNGTSEHAASEPTTTPATADIPDIKDEPVWA